MLKLKQPTSSVSRDSEEILTRRPHLVGVALQQVAQLAVDVVAGVQREALRGEGGARRVGRRAALGAAQPLHRCFNGTRYVIIIRRPLMFHIESLVFNSIPSTIILML